jgi:hypothetical protein
MIIDYRPRLSIDVPKEIFDRLNHLLGGWRIRGQLFRAITIDLVELLEKMDQEQRRFFIVSIIERDVGITKYIKTIGKAEDEAKRYKDLDT